MKHLCTNCGYIYDEINWEIEDWIDYWTKLDDIRENFVCPNCFESSENFQEIIPYLHSLDDEKNLSAVEKEHIPQVESLWNGEVRIDVNHPMEKEHFIWNIWIYDEYWDLVYEEFFKPWDVAYLEYDVSDLDKYEVRVQCNIHWFFSKWFFNEVE